jgi:putative holliday junction resolvase
MPDRSPGQPLTALAFDFGLRRIGIASGDTLTSTAAPRPAARNSDEGPDWSAIEREIRSLRPTVLVVGAPYNADGSTSTMTVAARCFAAELKRRFGLPVTEVDERFSSIEASAVLKARRASGARKRRVRRVRREDVDSAAAAVILERWLGGEGANEE